MGMPKEYHKWINQMINFTLKALAVHLAWKLQEIVSALQSGLMGGSLFATGLVITIGRCLDVARLSTLMQPTLTNCLASPWPRPGSGTSSRTVPTSTSHTTWRSSH